MLIVGETTYATVAEADAYATARGWADWTALTTAQKEARLIEAATYLDTSYDWKGRIVSPSQPMAWPRAGVVDNEGRPLPADAYPQRLLYAQIELARLASEPLVRADVSSAVTQVTAGSVSVSFDTSRSYRQAEALRYAAIDRLLNGLYDTRSGAGAIRNVPLSKA